jgi:hypothetical protein
MQWFPLAFYTIVFRHTVGLLWTSDQPVADASTCTGQHNIKTQETNIHALSGIRTLDPSNQAAADLYLRARGYRGRQSNSTPEVLSLWIINYETCHEMSRFYWAQRFITECVRSYIKPLELHNHISQRLMLWPCHASGGSRRPITVEARVRARVSSCGISGGQSGTGTGFLRVLQFSPVNIIPPWLSIKRDVVDLFNLLLAVSNADNSWA